MNNEKDNLNNKIKELEKELKLKEKEKSKLIINVCKNLDEKYQKLLKDRLEIFKKTLDLMLDQKQNNIQQTVQNKLIQLENLIKK